MFAKIWFKMSAPKRLVGTVSETNTLVTISVCCPSLSLSGLDSTKSVEVPVRPTPEITFVDNNPGGKSSILKTLRLAPVSIKQVNSVSPPR